MKVNIYTDGAAVPNPGKGGWAAILVCGKHRKEISGSLRAPCTNQTAELTAVLEGLQALTQTCEVTVYTDAQSVVNWMTNQWKRKKLHIVQLCAHIEDVIALGGHMVTYQWVKGHNGHPENERVDWLANTQAIGGVEVETLWFYHPESDDLFRDYRYLGEEMAEQVFELGPAYCPNCDAPTEVFDLASSNANIQCTQCSGRMKVISNEWEAK